MWPLGVLSVFVPHKNLLWILLTHKTDGSIGEAKAKGASLSLKEVDFVQNSEEQE